MVKPSGIRQEMKNAARLACTALKTGAMRTTRLARIAIAAAFIAASQSACVDLHYYGPPKVVNAAPSARLQAAPGPHGSTTFMNQGYNLPPETQGPLQAFTGIEPNFEGGYHVGRYPVPGTNTTTDVARVPGSNRMWICPQDATFTIMPNDKRGLHIGRTGDPSCILPNGQAVQPQELQNVNPALANHDINPWIYYPSTTIHQDPYVGGRQGYDQGGYYQGGQAGQYGYRAPAPTTRYRGEECPGGFLYDTPKNPKGISTYKRKCFILNRPNSPGYNQGVPVYPAQPSPYPPEYMPR